jgi:hypothetical protein
MASYPAGWYTDPVRRFQYRFWNGTQWTNQVSNSGTSGTDPDVLDPEMVATPPAPGSQAPGPPQPAAATPTVQVSQKSSSGLGVIVGVLIGILLVVIIVAVIIVNSGDDTSTTEPSVTVTTEAPTTTVAP